MIPVTLQVLSLLIRQPRRSQSRRASVWQSEDQTSRRMYHRGKLTSSTLCRRRLPLRQEQVSDGASNFSPSSLESADHRRTPPSRSQFEEIGTTNLSPRRRRAKIRNTTRMHTLDTFTQCSIGSSSHKQSGKKRKGIQLQKERSKIVTI